MANRRIRAAARRRRRPVAVHGAVADPADGDAVVRAAVVGARVVVAVAQAADVDRAALVGLAVPAADVVPAVPVVVVVKVAVVALAAGAIARRTGCRSGARRQRSRGKRDRDQPRRQGREGWSSLLFNALVAVGDGQGKVGFATGKANEVSEAVRKAVEGARSNMVSIPAHRLHDSARNRGQARRGQGVA